jgi:hypothetical protein
MSRHHTKLVSILATIDALRASVSALVEATDKEQIREPEIVARLRAMDLPDTIKIPDLGFPESDIRVAAALRQVGFVRHHNGVERLWLREGSAYTYLAPATAALRDKVQALNLGDVVELIDVAAQVGIPMLPNLVRLSKVMNALGYTKVRRYGWVRRATLGR